MYANGARWSGRFHVREVFVFALPPTALPETLEGVPPRVPAPRRREVAFELAPADEPCFLLGEWGSARDFSGAFREACVGVAVDEPDGPGFLYVY